MAVIDFTITGISRSLGSGYGAVSQTAKTSKFVPVVGPAPTAGTNTGKF